LIAKFAASTLGSAGLTMTWAKQQRREADEIALALLERSDRSGPLIALNLRAGLNREQLRAGPWSTPFRESTEWVSLIASDQPAAQLLATRKNPSVASELARFPGSSVAPL
jgi:hypothetical protein